MSKIAAEDCLMIDRLVIIGVGLIGGSLARALKKAGACREVIGSARQLGSLQKAQALGVIDRYEADAGVAVQGADRVVLAVPVGAMESVLRQIAGHLAPSAVITDTGSTKQNVVDAARRVFGDVPPNFVPGHPIAGTEKNGVEASFAELFQGRRVVLTPLPETSAEAVAKVRRMWEGAGATVVEMDVRRHDKVLAGCSHLPHLLAYMLVDSLGRLDEREDVFRLAAGGFRDFTRIAASDPVMWRDICLANREAIVRMLEHFTDDLQHLTRDIAHADGARLLTTFTCAKVLRDRFSAQEQS